MGLFTGTAALGLVKTALPFLGEVIDRVIPDPKAREEAKQNLIKMEQDGELKRLETQMSAIVMEAQSKDPWTSRARPSFLYVMYIMILAAIPMGILHAINSSLAVDIASGMQAWLSAIPEEMWWLFGAGYLGYAGARSFDKSKLVKGS